MRGFGLCPWVITLLLNFWTTQAFAWTSYTPGDTVDNYSTNGVTKGYRPEQPFPFDHSRHAGKLGMDCQYCHSSARRSAVAGIPSLNTCMGCHRFALTDSPKVQILKKHFDNNDPIQWTKVHDLPDYVRFSHQIHVAAENAQGQPLLACESCHGDVKKMTVAEQWAPLQMGWCVGCHTTAQKVASPQNTQRWDIEELRNTKITETPVGVRAIPGSFHSTNHVRVSCNTCHY